MILSMVLGMGCDVNRVCFFDLRFCFSKVVSSINTSVCELCGKHKDEGMFYEFRNGVIITLIAVADYNQRG